MRENTSFITIIVFRGIQIFFGSKPYQLPLFLILHFQQRKNFRTSLRKGFLKRKMKGRNDEGKETKF